MSPHCHGHQVKSPSEALGGRADQRLLPRSLRSQSGAVRGHCVSPERSPPPPPPQAQVTQLAAHQSLGCRQAG